MTDRVRAREVTEAIVNNMREGMEPCKYTILAPCLYQVYLHDEDHQRLKNIFDVIQRDAKQALDEEVAKYNNESTVTRCLRKLLSKMPKWLITSLEPQLLQPRLVLEVPVEGWQISFLDPNESLQPGYILIHSELRMPPETEYANGFPTLNPRSRSLRKVNNEAPGDLTLSSPSVYDTDSQTKITKTMRRISSSASQSGPVYAQIRYQCDGRPEIFRMTKNLIVIGRGRADCWVDLKINKPIDISHEHIRLRRDEHSGQFFIKDVSRLGTSIDGQVIPSSVEKNGDKLRDKNIEVPLPSRARIGLAGVLFLDFEAVESFQTNQGED